MDSSREIERCSDTSTVCALAVTPTIARNIPNTSARSAGERRPLTRDFIGAEILSATNGTLPVRAANPYE